MIEQIDLRRLDLNVTSMVDASILNNTKYSEMRALECDAMLLRMHYTVFGRQEIEVDVSYPKTWWDAVKDQWFPKWLKKRYPVEFNKIFVEKFVVFPDLKVPDSCGRTVVFRTKYEGTWTDA